MVKVPYWKLLSHLKNGIGKVGGGITWNVKEEKTALAQWSRFRARNFSIRELGGRITWNVK